MNDEDTIEKKINEAGDDQERGPHKAARIEQSINVDIKETQIRSSNIFTILCISILVAGLALSLMAFALSSPETLLQGTAHSESLEQSKNEEANLREKRAKLGGTKFGAQYPIIPISFNEKQTQIAFLRSTKSRTWVPPAPLWESSSDTRTSPICVLQSHPDENYSEEVVASRTLLFRWSLRHGYRYTFTNCKTSRNPFLAGGLCQLQGFDMGKPEAWPEGNACEYVYVVGPIAAPQMASAKIENVISWHNAKLPDWMTIAGWNSVQGIKKGQVLNTVSGAEYLINCRHSKTRIFLQELAKYTHREKDPEMFDFMTSYRPFHKFISADIINFGVYGKMMSYLQQADKHPPSTGKSSINSILQDYMDHYPEALNKESLLKESVLDVVTNRDHTDVFLRCPSTNKWKAYNRLYYE
eukprot:Nk52_evm22s684 gene=Nk52_evmTU22s684